jgi:hypothetical protein
MSLLLHRNKASAKRTIGACLHLSQTFLFWLSYVGWQYPSQLQVTIDHLLYLFWTFKTAPSLSAGHSRAATATQITIYFPHSATEFT